jgi:hypothetical protein
VRPPILHVTNGLSVVQLLQQAAIPGQYLPWQDVLHEGPVPSGLGVTALADRRADFIARAGWGAHEQIVKDFRARDATLQHAIENGNPRVIRAEEIVLWFEHDLYDQLQLLQILARLPVDGPPRVTAVPSPTYLGSLPAERYEGLFQSRQEVTSTVRLAARDAWDAFRAPDPRAIVEAMPRVTDLPHLGAALTRHLEQFPSLTNGLSRTERYALEEAADGPIRLADLFTRTNQREEAFFMGDAGFVFHIESLIRSSPALLRMNALPPFGLGSPEFWQDGTVELTADGARVLAAELDRVALCGIDRWLGGVYLAGRGPVWRWDSDHRQLRFA